LHGTRNGEEAWEKKSFYRCLHRDPDAMNQPVEQEAQLARRVLFPIRIDDTIQPKATWATDLHRLRQMEDFRNWEQQEGYQQAVSRLVSHLNKGVQEEKSSQDF
jgi:hypothetical protein